jgi:hypothetical protein
VTVDFSAWVAPHRAQVIRGFKSAQPSQLIGFIKLLARCASHIDIERLGLINPFLPTRCRLNQPLGLNFKRGGVQVLECLAESGRCAPS